MISKAETVFEGSNAEVGQLIAGTKSLGSLKPCWHQKAATLHTCNNLFNFSKRAFIYE